MNYIVFCFFCQGKERVVREVYYKAKISVDHGVLLYYYGGTN